MSRLKQKVNSLMRQRNQLEERLIRSGPLLKGSLFEQYRKCGKSGCKCERGERHGPYPYLVVGKGKARRLTYVTASMRLEIKRRAENSKGFAALLTRLDLLSSDITAGLKDIRRILESNP